jgi:hypothetical protein
MFVLMDEIKAEFRDLDVRLAATLRKLAEYDRSGDWRADGYANASAALQDQCRMDPGVAHGHVRLARRLEKFPEVAEAFGAGDISHGHARVIANAYTPTRAAELSNVETELVAAARELTPNDLTRAVKYVTDTIDGDGGAAADKADIDDSACYMSFSAGKLHFNGSCDQLTGEAIVAAVNAEMARDLQPNDPRSTPRRRMDALSFLCRLPLDRGELGESHGVRPHITATVDVLDIPGVTAGTVAKIRVEARRNNLSETMLELLLCDCDISRVIMAGRSEVLDVGRATPKVSPAQWKALVARDQHCQAPGCKRPPDHCQPHHIWHWTRGGPTDLNNLVLLCWNHHRERHINDAKARAG